MLPFAVRTGLEPATPGVTGRYSNQLNYRTIVQTLEPMEGVEPTTPRLQITCSGQLSYIGSLVSFFSKGLQRYNFLRYALQVVDNFLGFLGRNRREPSEGLSIPLDHFFEHGFGPYPYTSFTIHGLIYDHLLEGFRMFCYVKDTVDVALEMSVIFSCHDNKVTKIVRLSIHIEAGPLHKN